MKFKRDEEMKIIQSQLVGSFYDLIVKLGSRSVQVRSRLGPGQLHVKSKSFNIKVYLKSPRDLDLELEAIIAMSPTHHHP